MVLESDAAFQDRFAIHTVVEDEDRFVTGQNRHFGHTTAQAMLALLRGPPIDTAKPHQVSLGRG